MSSKSILIIGSGISGLSAGYYGQINGYRTRILEMHDKPGGLCCSWERGDYTFEGCLGGLLQVIDEGGKINPLWEELNILNKLELTEYQSIKGFFDHRGNSFSFDGDIQKLKNGLIKISPQDRPRVETLFRQLFEYEKLTIKIKNNAKLSLFKRALNLSKLYLFFLRHRHLKETSVAEFASGLSNEFLRDIFLLFPLYNNKDLPLDKFMKELLWAKRVLYPIGGSKALIQSLTSNYLELGGRIDYRAKVVKIIHTDNRATGVILKDGARHYADYIISTVDWHQTLFSLLEKTPHTKEVLKAKSLLPTLSPTLQISLGVNRVFPAATHSARGDSYILESSATIGGIKVRRFDMAVYNFDPTLAPAGKTFVRIVIEADYDFWDKLRNDPVRYQEEKNKAFSLIITLAEKHFPGISKDIETSDLATPLTFQRYTGGWQGSCGWKITTASRRINIPKTIPKLNGFFMSGHWTADIKGIPTTVQSSRRVVEKICRLDKKKFFVKDTVGYYSTPFRYIRRENNAADVTI